MQLTLAVYSAETGGGGGVPTTTVLVIFDSATQGAKGQPVDGLRDQS